MDENNPKFWGVQYKAEEPEGMFGGGVALCSGCGFITNSCLGEDFPPCTANMREDNRNVIFVEVTDG